MFRSRIYFFSASVLSLGVLILTLAYASTNAGVSLLLAIGLMSLGGRLDARATHRANQAIPGFTSPDVHDVRWTYRDAPKAFRDREDIEDEYSSTFQRRRPAKLHVWIGVSVFMLVLAFAGMFVTATVFCIDSGTECIKENFFSFPINLIESFLKHF